jgi:transposase InsO family protein
VIAIIHRTPHVCQAGQIESYQDIDIPYIPMRGGFLYLVAVLDWYSRFVLSWELSNTMETGFCLAALGAAFRVGQPEIWNSDQRSQFTSADFLAPLKRRGILASMDGCPNSATTLPRRTIPLAIRHQTRRERERRRLCSTSVRIADHRSAIDAIVSSSAL